MQTTAKPNPHAEGERALVVKDEDSGQSEDFERLARISEYLENEDFQPNAAPNYRQAASYDGERDKKLDAMNNTAARGITLAEHLLGQWAFIECPQGVRKAGEAIINNIDAGGYFRADMENVRKESKVPLTIEDLTAALRLIQTLEPSGVGARNLRECLLLQLDAVENDEELAQGHDFNLERTLITEHLKDLEMNRYPQISRRLGLDIDEIKSAVHRISRLHPFPGKQIGGDDAPPITPDAIIYYDEETDKYEIEMSNDPAPNLYISGMYRKWLKDKKHDKKTREFLANNVRNARWLLESIEQRKSTIHAGDSRGSRCTARVLRQGPGIPPTAADDPCGRPARYSRRHRIARRQRKMDSDAARRFPPPPIFLRRHHQRRRRRHELGRREGKTEDHHRR